MIAPQAKGDGDADSWESREEETQMGIFWSEVTGALLSLERAYAAQMEGTCSFPCPTVLSSR